MRSYSEAVVLFRYVAIPGPLLLALAFAMVICATIFWAVLRRKR